MWPIEDGDRIKIDIPGRRIDVDISADELAERHRREEAKGDSAFRPPQRPRKISNALKAYALLASSADKGAIRVIPD